MLVGGQLGGVQGACGPRTTSATTCTSAGARKPSSLTEVERRICDLIRPRLVADGLYFVGVDLVGDAVLEINVYAPGGIHNINELYGVRRGGGGGAATSSARSSSSGRSGSRCPRTSSCGREGAGRRAGGAGGVLDPPGPRWRRNWRGDVRGPDGGPLAALVIWWVNRYAAGAPGRRRLPMGRGNFTSCCHAPGVLAAGVARGGARRGARGARSWWRFHPAPGCRCVLRVHDEQPPAIGGAG
jgi:hypothetical protein